MTTENTPLFQNPQLELERLPLLAEIQFVKLSPAYWKYSIATTIVGFVIFGLPLIGLWFGAEAWIAALVSSLWGLLFLVSLFLTRLKYNLKGYALRAHDIVYRRGLIFRSLTTIPFSRLQHCEIQEGPIERIFGLNTLLVYTAGGSGSDLSIPGLPPEDAKRLRDFILGTVIGKDEEE